MPTLTAITETKRGRYALFFDGEFAFSLDEDTFAAVRPACGRRADRNGNLRPAAEKRRPPRAGQSHGPAGAARPRRGRTVPEALPQVRPPHRRGRRGQNRRAGPAGRRGLCPPPRRRAAAQAQKPPRNFAGLAAKGVDRETAAAAVEALRPEDAAEAGEDPDLASARALVARQYARKLAEGKTQQVMAAWPAAAFPTASSRPRWGKRWKNWKRGMGNEERPRPGRCFHTGNPAALKRFRPGNAPFRRIFAPPQAALHHI